MNQKPKNTLLILRGLVHPTWLACRRLQQVFEATPGFEFLYDRNLESLLRLDPSQITSLALYFHHKRISPAALDRLDELIRNGLGLLAVHGAAASFKTEPRYHAILGGRFIGHGPVTQFEIQPSPGQHIFRGIGSFNLRDELYRHEYDPSNEVHFFTSVGEEQEPVVWTRRHGEGRICYCSLGHTSKTFQHPAVIEILRQGLMWVSGEDALRKETA